MTTPLPIPVITLSIEGIESLSAVHDAMPRAAERLVGKVAFAVRQEMHEQAPSGQRRQHPKSKRPARRQGLEDSFEVFGIKKAGFKSEATVGTKIAYGGYVDQGTKPHKIQNRRAKALAIYAPDAPDADEFGFIFRKRVKHPGSKGDGFAKRAVEEVGANRELLDRLLGKSLEQSGIEVSPGSGGGREAA